MVQLTDKYWAVELPDDATHIKIHESYQCSKIVFSSDIQDPLKCGGDMIRIPPGSWQYLFTTKGCTEEQAASVVEYVVSEMVRGYRDYDSLKHKEVIEAIVDTPQQSLNSLLRSNGCDINKNLAIIQNLNT